MKKETFIVLFPVSGINARKNAEDIENVCYTLSNITAYNVYKEVLNDLPDSEGVEVESITDFMDRVNDEEFAVDNYFISYVYGCS